MSFTETRQQFFPLTLADGITIRTVDSADAYAIIEPLIYKVFSAQGDLGLSRPTQAPQQLRDKLQRHSENFIFYNADDEPIGWSFGWQIEGDTFYMNWSGILPAYHNRGIYSAFQRRFLDYLHALGYLRVTSNHFVNNRPVLVAKLKAGFTATGMTLDERWGACLRMTYFFEDTQRSGFRKAFSLENYE